MYSVTDAPTLPGTGFPIQKSPDQSLFSSSPKLIAACHVFHRLLTPRHPPFALNSLATKQLTQSYQTFSCTYKQIVKEQCDDNLYKKTTSCYKKAVRYFFGGGERVRTDDLLRARQALSQLSYTPNSIANLRLKISNSFHSKFKDLKSKFVVGLDGIEPSTSRLSGVRSNRTELQAPSILDCGFRILNCLYLIQSKI